MLVELRGVVEAGVVLVVELSSRGSGYAEKEARAWYGGNIRTLVLLNASMHVAKVPWSLFDVLGSHRRNHSVPAAPACQGRGFSALSKST